MATLSRMNVGLVGAAGRGGTFRTALESNGASVHAVCDTRSESLARCANEFGAREQYSSYDEMLAKSDLDAVVIGTPQHLHVPQAIQALARDLHVLSEVPAGISMAQCFSLVDACYRSRAMYMMAENYTYIRDNVLVRSLVEQGLFGEVYYAEGEYLHDVTELAEQTTWRRYWQLGIDGVTYPTHSLGPVLQWMPGDRVSSVSCAGSGRHRRDPRGDLYHQDSSVMLCKTTKGSLIKIRTDLVSPRPHAMNNYQLQGTTGAYESPRAPGERSRLWLRELSSSPRWFFVDDLVRNDDFADRYLPEIWRHPPEDALRAGHGGGDYFEVRDFVRAARGEAGCPIGVHEALDMTLPGLVSQKSIQEDGAWLDVPDSRTWTHGERLEQLQMTWPERRSESPPRALVPAEYRLRNYEESDEPAYIRLMDGAGFTGWNRERIGRMIGKTLPRGFFVVEHVPTGRLAATAMATHNPSAAHPYGGELGWVAGDPRHAGKGLGLAVCSAVVRRLLEAGYRRIYLLTDDFRLPALKIYLKMGFEPYLFCHGMRERWDAIYEKLGWKQNTDL